MFAIAKISASAAATLGLMAGFATAGGFVAPVAPISPPVTAPVAAGDWAGAYGGLSLGYSFGADDEIGFSFLNDDVEVGRQTALENVKIKGPTADLHAGYRWQRGNWVYGPELAIEGGSVDDSRTFQPEDFSVSPEPGTTIDYEFGPTELTASVNYIATLAFKTGYVVNPQTLVYGTAGVNHGDFDYELSSGGDSVSQSYSQTGWVLGLGVERKLTERVSMFAEYQYRQFGKSDIYFGDDEDSIQTQATPKHQNIKLGVNFRF